MTAIILSQFAKRVLDTVNGDCAGDLVVNDFYVDLAAGDLVAGNVIDFGILPAGHSISNVQLIPDDLDTNGTPTLALDIGLMSGTPGANDATRTVGQELFAGSTAAQTGSVVTPTLKSAYTVQAQNYDRSIGVKIATGPATAAAGRLRARVTMYAANSGVQF